MDKLKNLVSSRDNTSPETAPSTSSSGRLTGPGSHFPKGEEPLPADTVGSSGTAASGYVPGTDAKQESQATSASGLSGPGSGTAAVGQTSTYSSHTLATGDAVGGVADPFSADQTTYQMPEHSYTSSRGIPEGGPLAAAAAAFHKDKDYSTSNLPGAYPSESVHDSTTVAPSLSAAAASTADRSATYTQTEKTTVPDASAAAQSATSAASTSREPVTEEPKKTSTVGKILGAVGLGTAAAGAGAATSRAHDDHDTSAVTQSTSTSGLTQPGPGQGHHRKESIPTTAYPAGINSPAATSAPVGGTTPAQERERNDHTGRNAGLAAAGAGAAVGGAAFGAHQYGQSKDLHDSSSGFPSTQTTSQTTAPSTSTGYGQRDATLRENPTASATASGDSGRDSSGYGKTAAAAGVGAGAGAAGAYALQNKDPETERSDWPLRDDTTSKPAAAAPYSDRQSRYEEPSQKDTARKEAALAGTTVGSGQGEQQVRGDEEAEQRRRHEKEAALAGVAGAGAGAAGLHEHNKHQAEEEEARRHKDMTEQEEARRKQYEKDEKAAKKEAKKEEKQQAKEEKAIAKEEKKHQKEVEKEEKKQQKELEKQKSHEKAAVGDYDQQEELERERREKELAAGGAGGGALAGTAAHQAHEKEDSGPNKLHKDPPDEKKPSLLKRIFRRRKNKDTGEDEEYEDDEDSHERETENRDHHLATTGGGAETGAGTGTALGGTTASATSHESSPHSYEAQSGGATKPSYNPFTKDDPATMAAVTGQPSSTADPALQTSTQHDSNVYPHGTAQ